MKKSRRIVKKMSKKSLINKKALRYIIANSNLCKHAIRELELAGYSKEEDGPNKWMREQVIEAVALFSSHGNSGFSAPFEINLVKKLCSFDIISPLRFDDGEWEKIGLDGSCQNKRKSSIFKEPDGSIHDVDAFSKVPVKKFLFATRTWTENIHKIGWIGGLFETDENGILTGRYFGRCNVKDYQNGYMPKGKKEIPCREIEISPDNWIMTVESNNEALIELSKIYDIVWRQCPCLKGIMNTNELTVDEFIRGRMKKVVDSNIETMVESKAKSFVNELRKRYDMAFAAFIVDNMRKQNMLKDDKIAELLKDNPNEK